MVSAQNPESPPFFAFPRRKHPDRIFGFFLKMINVFPAFLEKSRIHPNPATRCPSIGVIAREGYVLAPVFSKNFKNFSEIHRPKGGGRGNHPLPVPWEPVTPFIQVFLANAQ